MPGIVQTISTIMGCMVYGPEGALYGGFDEVSVPEVKNKVQDNKPTDLIGTRRLPALSIDPMESTFKTSGYNVEFHAMASNPYMEQNIQVRGNVIRSKGQGRTQKIDIRLDLRGWFSSAKVGAFKQGEAAQCEYKMEVHALKLVVEGKEIQEVDIDNYIWRVNGEDLIADFKKNLGIT
jgi:P2 family phage contractile tail tube protein